MIELIFKNMTSIKLERDNIIEFNFDDLVAVDDDDLVVTDFRMTISADKETLDNIEASQLAYFLYKGRQYFVNYEDDGYVGGPNINQTIIRKDNKLYITVK